MKKTLIAFTLTASILSGCSAPSSSAETSKSLEISKETTAAETTAVDTTAVKTAVAGTTAAETTAGETLSQDEQDIQNITQRFVDAYFSGDENNVQNFLSDTYTDAIAVYEGDSSTIKDIAIKGISEIHQKSSGDTCQVSVQYKGDFETDGDTFRYLTINFVSQEDEWKIDFYGVEG